MAADGDDSKDALPVWNTNPTTLQPVLLTLPEPLLKLDSRYDMIIHQGVIVNSRSQTVVRDPFHFLVHKHRLLADEGTIARPCRPDRDYRAVLVGAGFDPEAELAEASATPRSTPAAAGSARATGEPDATDGDSQGVSISFSVGGVPTTPATPPVVTAANFELNSVDRLTYIIAPDQLDAVDRSLQLQVLGVIGVRSVRKQYEKLSGRSGCLLLEHLHRKADVQLDNKAIKAVNQRIADHIQDGLAEDTVEGFNAWIADFEDLQACLPERSRKGDSQVSQLYQDLLNEISDFADMMLQFEITTRSRDLGRDIGEDPFEVAEICRRVISQDGTPAAPIPTARFTPGPWTSPAAAAAALAPVRPCAAWTGATAASCSARVAGGTTTAPRRTST